MCSLRIWKAYEKYYNIIKVREFHYDPKVNYIPIDPVLSRISSELDSSIQKIISLEPLGIKSRNFTRY